MGAVDDNADGSWRLSAVHHPEGRFGNSEILGRSGAHHGGFTIPPGGKAKGRRGKQEATGAEERPDATLQDAAPFFSFSYYGGMNRVDTDIGGILCHQRYSPHLVFPSVNYIGAGVVALQVQVTL